MSDPLPMPDFVLERVEHMAHRMRLTSASPADVVILLLSSDSEAARWISLDLGHEPGWWDRHRPGGMVLIPALASRAWIIGLLELLTKEVAPALRAIEGLALVVFAGEDVLVHEHPWRPA